MHSDLLDHNIVCQRQSLMYVISMACHTLSMFSELLHQSNLKPISMNFDLYLYSHPGILCLFKLCGFTTHSTLFWSCRTKVLVMSDKSGQLSHCSIGKDKDNF